MSSSPLRRPPAHAVLPREHALRDGLIAHYILAHHTWLARFQTALCGYNRETFDLSTAHDVNACELGRWLDSPQCRTLVDASAHAVLRIVHRDFHASAARLATLFNHSGPIDEIRQQMSVFEALSHELFAHLRALALSIDAGDVAASSD